MKRINLFVSILLGIIGILVWYSLIRPVNIPDPIITYEYMTDTVWVDTLYLPGQPYMINTPAKTITYYRIDSAALDSLTIILTDQNILIEGLKDSIRINQNFLKHYPSNPKLLAMTIRHDTLAMGLLDITGQIAERSWPLNLNQFTYHWAYGSNLSRHSVQQPPIQEQHFVNYFIGGGVDLLRLSPYLSGKVEKSWSSIRIRGEASIGLLNRNTSSLRIGLDYKLNGKSTIRND